MLGKRKNKEVDTPVEAVETEEKPKRKMFTDILKEAAERIDKEAEGKSGEEVHNVGKIITLLYGNRVFSEEKTIAPNVKIRFGNLTPKHKNFISSMCLDKDNLDDDGKPKYNEKLSLDLTLAFMWSELNGVAILDPMDAKSGIEKIDDLWSEITERTEAFHSWPLSWLDKFIEGAQEYTQELIDTCSESNVKAF